jgi:hypothetical protein
MWALNYPFFCSPPSQMCLLLSMLLDSGNKEMNKKQSLSSSTTPHIRLEKTHKCSGSIWEESGKNFWERLSYWSQHDWSFYPFSREPSICAEDWEQHGHFHFSQKGDVSRCSTHIC